jgi:hypothetical protein
LQLSRGAADTGPAGVFIQVAHERGGVYEFQHRTGSVPYMWVTEVTDPDLVADVMTRWARQEAEWDAGQCTRSAAEGHGLTLYYGGFDDSAQTTTTVGHQVVAALGAAGLSAQWDGDPDQAIAVTPLTWRKRLVG